MTAAARQPGVCVLRGPPHAQQQPQGGHGEHRREEVTSYSKVLLGKEPVVIGITAGASCPSNLIESTVLKVFELRGIDAQAVREA